MSSFIKSQMESIITKLNKPSIPADIKLEARNELRKVRGHARLMSQPDGYKEFLLEYVQREAQRFSTDDPEEDGFESRRTRPVCTCPNRGCDLKRGQVPLEVRNSDSISKGIRRFEQEHLGRPVVLHDARKEYSRRADHTEEVLMTVNIALTHKVSVSELDGTREVVDV